MDPLSEVLTFLRPSSYGFRGIDVGGTWAIDFPPVNGIRCFAATSGECWVWSSGQDAIRLAAGDYVLLPRGRPLRVGSSLDARPADPADFFSAIPDGETGTINGGGSFSGLGGYFVLASSHADRLLSLLPYAIHFRAEADRNQLRWSIERLMQELCDPQPGGSLIAEHLAQTVLILALRQHLASQPEGARGWLFALADRQLSAAIGAMHAQPGQRWTLESLANVAGMSRLSFAAKFKTTV